MNDPKSFSDAALADIQDSLSTALRYWLYQSVSSCSFLKNNTQKCFLRTTPLQACVQHFKRTGHSVPATRPIQKKKFPVHHYADELARLYQIWEETLHKQKESIAPEIFLPESIHYNIWLDRGGDRPKYEPVRELHKLLKTSGSYFKRAIVHGSIPTLEDQDGFSDMDLAFIIRSDVLKNPEALINLRNQSRKYLELTYSFDPFMHHGPYYLSELDFMWYSQPRFPVILFKHGLELLENPHPQNYTVRADTQSSLDALKIFHSFFSKRYQGNAQPKNRYELEWVLGSTMLLPALFLQQLTGEFLFKRETFPKAEKFFSESEWSPIRLATMLRCTLPPRCLPGNTVLHLSRIMGWPGLIQRSANHLPHNRACARRTFSELGNDFYYRVILLIETMLKIIKEHES